MPIPSTLRSRAGTPSGAPGGGAGKRRRRCATSWRGFRAYSTSSADRRCSFAARCRSRSGYDLDALHRHRAWSCSHDRRTASPTSTTWNAVIRDPDRPTRKRCQHGRSRDIADRVVANVRGELATRYTCVDRRSMCSSQHRPHASSIDEVRRLIVNPDSAAPCRSMPLASSASQGPAEIRVAQERVAIITANLAMATLAQRGRSGAILGHPKPRCHAVVTGRVRRCRPRSNR